MADQASPSTMRPLGLPDEAFEQRSPLRGQITKREVRAVSLYLLGIRSDGIVWDIGAGTGSISIEASLVAHNGAVYAVERDADSIGLLFRNTKAFGGPNLYVVHDEAPSALKELPSPDSVFVGGSGGSLAGILDASVGRLRPGGKIVANLATLERTNDTYRQLKEKGLRVELTVVSASRGREMPDGAIRLEAFNPVFIVSAQMPEAGT